MDDCQALADKYPQYYVQFKVSLVVTKALAESLLKPLTLKWDIASEGLKGFDVYYFIRNLLAIKVKDENENHFAYDHFYTQAQVQDYEKEY